MDTLEKYAPKKHNRKKENIELLEYLLKEFQTNPSLEDVRLGQLIVNSIPSPDNLTRLFMIESDELKENIELSLKY